MKIRRLSFVALPLFLIGGLLLACAVCSSAQNGVDQSLMVGEGVKELLTENLEEECFRDNPLEVGRPLSISLGRFLFDKRLFAVFSDSTIDCFSISFSGWILPLRI